MQVIKSDVRRALLGLLMPSASVLLLASVGWQSGFAASLPLFAGITSLETRVDPKSLAQVVAFSADMPFQYQMQILDKNHVVFRLYNARLANNLLTPEGSVNLLASGAVESARVRTPNKGQATQQNAYQEIVFTGPELGTRHFQVQGATELPLVKSLAPLQSPVTPQGGLTKALAKLASRPIPPGEPVMLVGKHPAKALQNLSALQQNLALQRTTPGNQSMALIAVADSPATQAHHTGSALQQRIEIEPVDRPQTRFLALPPASSPQIESMTNTMTPPDSSAAFAPPTEDASETPVEVEPATGDSGLQYEKPDNQMLIPLPRYHGGAAPIQATTLDANGNPVMIHPKNSPIQEFNLDSRNGGYNALFQADPQPEPDKHRRVDGLVNDALSLYRQRQYLQAEQKIEHALQMEQSNADLYAALAEIQLELGQKEAAMQSYRQASQLSPREYGQAYAQVLVQAGKRQDAIQVLEGLNQQQPRQEQIVYMLGTLHEELGQVGPALTYLKQAAQLHPASADIQYNLGLAYELSGDREQAEKHYRSALTLNPEATDIARALARVRND